ncbi:hypothetical protein GOV14_03680 [Candidatus Pacearchaeota archaeon]|nr:hypothetical protein [Candidatus Pacearchaeota archaeon]
MASMGHMHFTNNTENKPQLVLAADIMRGINAIYKKGLLTLDYSFVEKPTLQYGLIGVMKYDTVLTAAQRPRVLLWRQPAMRVEIPFTNESGKKLEELAIHEVEEFKKSRQDQKNKKIQVYINREFYKTL